MERARHCVAFGPNRFFSLSLVSFLLLLRFAPLLLPRIAEEAPPPFSHAAQAPLLLPRIAEEAPPPSSSQKSLSSSSGEPKRPSSSRESQRRHRLPPPPENRRLLLWRAQALPPSSQAVGPSPALVVVYFHGGGFCIASFEHHIAVRYGSDSLSLDPVRVSGCVLLCSYFGGEERTASEAVSSPDALMGLSPFDQIWRLALSAGATRDHPAANPFGPESAPLDRVAFPPVLVVDADQDMLRDRTADYVARLRAMGKPVELVVLEGQGHAFFVYEPWGTRADELVCVARWFVVHATGTPSTAT